MAESTILPSDRSKLLVPSPGWVTQGGAGAPHDAGPCPTGLFVYPLDEYTTVIGFEAVIADRVVTVQIKDKAKMESGHIKATRIRATTVTGKEARKAVSGPGSGWSLRQAERAVTGQGRASTELGVGNPL